MLCYYHSDRHAVGQCMDCGKYLCKECTDFWTIPLCDNCNHHRLELQKKSTYKQLLIMAFLACLGILFSLTIQPINLFASLSCAYAFAGIYAGWLILDKITPNIFLLLPIIGWIFYFVIKISIASIIGWFVLPFKLNKLYRAYKDTKKYSTYFQESHNRTNL